MKSHIKNENNMAFEYARILTAHYSKSFYLSARMLPKEKRRATYGLYGFCRYADNLIDNPRDRSVKEILCEMDSLRKEMLISYRTGESEHPVIHAFVTVAKKYGIPIEYPLDLLLGVSMDIQNRRYKTFNDLYTFCYRVAGVVGIMMTYVLGYKDPGAFIYAEKLGVAMQLTNILRDIQEDKNAGRISLALEELNIFCVSEKDIINEHVTINFQKMMKYQIERAHSYFFDAQPGIRLLDKNSQFAIYAASKIYQGILSRVEAQNFDPFKGRVYVPTSHKLKILLSEKLRTKYTITQEKYLPQHS